MRFGTPEKCIVDFLDAWFEQNVDRLFKLCQLFWRFNHKINGKIWLKKLFQNWQLKGYEILEIIPYKEDKNIEVEKPNPITNENEKVNIKIDKNAIIDIKVKLDLFYPLTKKVKIATSTVRLMKEKFDNNKIVNSPMGDWGVNPISLLRIEETDAAAVNNHN